MAAHVSAQCSASKAARGFATRRYAEKVRRNARSVSSIYYVISGRNRHASTRCVLPRQVRRARPRRGPGQQILGPAFPETVLFLLALPRSPEPPQQAETATGVLSSAQRVGDLQRDVQAALQLSG